MSTKTLVHIKCIALRLQDLEFFIQIGGITHIGGLRNPMSTSADLRKGFENFKRIKVPWAHSLFLR